MIRVEPAGDGGWQVVLADAPTPEAAVVHRARDLAERVVAARLPGVREALAGYQSVLVLFDQVSVNPAAVRDAVTRLAAEPARPGRARGARHRLALCVCPACALDRDFAVQTLGKPWKDIVTSFAAPAWDVWLTGFQPGFSFLGPLPGNLALPRLASPRGRLPAGSAGIGGTQAGLYAHAGPGGWRILGRTDAVLFDPDRKKPALLVPGDSVSFTPTEDHASLAFAER